MSFDLAVWHETTPITTQDAVRKYHQLCDSNTDLVHAHPGVDAFYQELVQRYPELHTYADEDLEQSPWNAEHDRSPAHVIVSIAWSRAGEVAPVVADIASRHGLVCLDPQVPVVHYPPFLLGMPHLRLQTMNGRVVDNPTPAEIAQEIAGIAAEANHFAGLERTNLTYMQTEIAENREIFALEYQDGALDRHYRVEGVTRAAVVQAFQEYAVGNQAWKARYRWKPYQVRVCPENP